MRRTIGSLIAILLAWQAPIGAQPKDVKDFCKKLKGNVYWLNVDVIRVDHAIRITDATSVGPDSSVTYSAKMGPAYHTTTQNPNEFVEEVRRLVNEVELTALAQVIKKGTKVRIRKVKTRKDHVEIFVVEPRRVYTSIRFGLGREAYTLAQFKGLFAVVFSEEEPTELGLRQTAEITKGMSIEDVIQLRGQPETRVDLGPKTVLTYDDLKLIFRDGKLVDAE